MGTLLHRTSGARHELSARDLLGRSRHCDLRLEVRAASGEHALVTWVAERWVFRDLGSRNGSFVDGARVEPGANVPLASGAELDLGGEGDRWVLVDDAAPTPMARALDVAEVVLAEASLLALPSADEPEVTVYLDEVSGWLLESRGAVEAAVDRAVVVVRARPWMLRLPDAVGSTASVEGGRATPTPELCFKVSRDEEHVELVAVVEGRTYDLGARAHHQCLLQLARARRSDAANPDLPETSHGWVYQDDLVRMLAIDEGRLNVDIYRARKQLAKAGVPNAAAIVERRPDTKQLRIGARQLHEAKL